MSNIKKTISHSSHYFIGGFLKIISGIIAFPILTRIFSVEDFGILSFISSFIFIPYALGRAGIGKSVVRFYEEYKKNSDKETLSRFYSSVFLGTFCTATLAAIISWFGLKIFLNSFFSRNLSNVVYLLTILVFLHPIISIFFAIYRAQQRTRIYNILSIINVYTTKLFSLVFCILFIKSIFGYYLGFMIPELLIFIYLLFAHFRFFPVKIKNFSTRDLLIFIKYGLPLLIFEIFHIVLTYGDRVVIQYYLKEKQLGLYAVGYEVANYLANAFSIPLSLAIMPIYMKIWVNEGKEATQTYLSKTLKYYLLLIIPVICGAGAVSKELIIISASKKYVDSYNIVFIIILGTVIFDLNSILCSGFHIYKKTGILAFSLFVAGTFNILLNIILVPSFGLFGAAFATFLTYFLLIIFTASLSYKLIKLRFDLIAIGISILASTIMYYVIVNIHLDHILVNLLMKVIVGTIIYAMIVIPLEKDSRKISCYYSKKYILYIYNKCIKERFK